MTELILVSKRGISFFFTANGGFKAGLALAAMKFIALVHSFYNSFSAPFLYVAVRASTSSLQPPESGAGQG
jgi:hypothetical protein